MRIGGLQKLSLIDYPGKIAAVIFTQGCNFRCGYCHNAELVCPQLFQTPIKEEDTLRYLQSRCGKLEGVVITGGEPTLQEGLIDFIIRVKKFNFLVKIDTNGSNPEILSQIINLKIIDYIAMDIKMPIMHYKFCEPAKIRQSVDLIINSGIAYQFRTTLSKNLCSIEDLESIQKSLGAAQHYVLQPFIVSEKMIDPSLRTQEQYTQEEFEKLKIQFERHNEICVKTD